MDNVQIFDANGIEQNAAWLEAKYGKVSVARAPASEKAFRLVAVYENCTGNIGLKVTGRKEDGSPAQNNVAFHWPGADHQKQGCKTQPTNRFMHQALEGQGVTAFGLGRGAYYWPKDEGGNKVGPHWVWICASLDSDVVKGLGMLSGTNHHHMDLVFAIQVPQTMPHPLHNEPGPDPIVQHGHDSPPGLGISGSAKQLDHIESKLSKLSAHLGL